MRAAVMSASGVSLPKAAFRCSPWRRSSASDFLRAFVSKYRSNACASVMEGFRSGAASAVRVPARYGLACGGRSTTLAIIVVNSAGSTGFGTCML